jgi:hypothetical protein
MLGVTARSCLQCRQCSYALRRTKSRWQASAHTASLTQIVPDRRHIHIYRQRIHIEYCPQPIGNRKAGMRAAISSSFELMVDS